MALSPLCLSRSGPLSLLRSLSRSQGVPARAMSAAQWARELFGVAVKAVQPDSVLSSSLTLQGGRLLVGGQSFAIDHNLYLVGFGKAVLGMAAAAERVVGGHLVRGVVSVPHGIQDALRREGRGEMLLSADSRVRVMEGAMHNLPDSAAQQAAQDIQKLASGLGEGDLLLALVSGGGSALLPAPTPPVSLQEKLTLTRALAAQGATIQELNTVRTALSELKGGGLARCARPAQVVGLILSDVIGDPVDLIASGPTVPSLPRPRDARAVLQRYGLEASLPPSVQDVLSRLEGQEDSEGRDGTDRAPQPHNVVIGSNTLALQAAGRRAQELGLCPVLLSPGVCGDVGAVARLYALLAAFACAARSPGGPPAHLTPALLELGPQVGVEAWDLMRTLQALDQSRGAVCLLAGGEPTVQLRGGGRGGRNQELALRVGLALGREELPLQGVVFLSGGTDGQDGPTEAAGAVADTALEQEAREQGLDPDTSLRENDSFSFFQRLSAGRRLLCPGLTGTNVMDVHLLLLPPQP
ncbi:glycerate kinase [Amia ocellicauda]|uniref:glycerate kinase n=1 Tax=Amia ocellicauda TaxID=2972642 RepID=UPI003463BF85